MIKTGVNESEEQKIEELKGNLEKKGSVAPEVKVIEWDQEKIKVEITSEEGKEIKEINRNED